MSKSSTAIASNPSYGLSYNNKDNRPKTRFERELYSLKKDAKYIRDLGFIMNTILGSACYSNKELENQISKGERLGNLNNDELKMLKDGWHLRQLLAGELMDNLKILIEKYYDTTTK